MYTGSPRVAQGGIFHVKKVTYSPETHALLKELIEESKLSIFQRRKLQESVKNGEPLPLPPGKTANGKRIKPEKEENVKFFEIPRRRKKEVISQSGAYEREAFVPNYEIANHEIEKKRLQDLMAFGRTIRQDKNKILAKIHAKKKVKDDLDILLDKDKLYTETLRDIKEKMDFLKFMEGQGKKYEYESTIKQEICAKLRLIEELDEDFRTDLREEYKKIQERAALTVFGR